jgi:hypothetical protein
MKKNRTNIKNPVKASLFFFSSRHASSKRDRRGVRSASGAEVV